ncbi:MAG: PAS domain-containing sensor histidine kinase, partial [Euryarchaeota archaeon]|nr:PAS domain-containing sensor histidine kinase [Euryarchaeota archaeon]
MRNKNGKPDITRKKLKQDEQRPSDKNDIREPGISEDAINKAISLVEEEKNRSNAIIQAIGDGIIIQDTDFKILYQNQIHSELYGNKVGEYCYRVYGSGEICDGCPLVLSFRDGGIHKAEKKVVKDQGIFYYEFTTSPLKNSTGKIIAGIKVVRDVTEHRRAEEALRESERFMENIFASIPDGIGILDMDMNIIRVNPTAQKWYPHVASFVGKKCYEAFHGSSERCEVCPAWRTLNTGETAYDIIPKHDPGGKTVGWVEIYSYPMIDTATGKMKGVIEYVRDITERKQIEEGLKLFSEAVEEAPDGFQIVDLTGNVTYSNRAVEEMYGIPREELKGKHVNVMNVDSEFAGMVILPSIIETGRWAGELMVKHKDGHEFPIWLNTSMVRDQKGNPIAMVGIIRDITERSLFEKALKESEERYRSLFENSPISLWEEDSSRVKKYIDGLRNKGITDFRTYFESHPEEVERCSKMVRVINVNKATLSMFRARSKEELLKGLTKIFTEHSYDIFREELLSMAEGSTVFEGEDFVKTLTGNVLHIYMKWSVAPGYEGTYSRRQVSIIDITERKRTEEAIKKYAQKLEESNRMKELFIDIMHHDLMNPLATASGFAELLKEEDAGNRMYIETIEKNLVKSMDLIECATNFSKIDGLERIDFSEMDLKEVIDGAIENLRPMAKSAGMEIESIITGSMPVKANKIIEDVFSNLIS